MSMQGNVFNPIQTSQVIARSYQEYIASTIHFDDDGLQGQLEDILGERRFLSKGPFIEAAHPYRSSGVTVRDLVEEGLFCRSMLDLGNGDASAFALDRPLYLHQERAIRKAASGRNYAVVTGTGSGKTECFLLPILNDILSEFERDEASPGVRAILLYPMNALANDQLKRLRELVRGTDITFGRYTGDTEERPQKAHEKWNEENPGDKKLPNEIISREEIRKSPPNILLTNYAMLEHLLLRPADASLFGSVFGAKWRHIAIDEAHVYAGSLGTEVSFLIRRLKARIASETGCEPRLHCYATSATIGDPERDMPRVARFAQGLFGEPFFADGDDIDVITSEKDDPAHDLAVDPWGALPLDRWLRLRELLADGGRELQPDAVAELLAGSVPRAVLDKISEEEDVLVGLGAVLLGEASTAQLVRATSSGAIDLTDVEAIAGLGIPGLFGDERGVSVLTAMVEVLSHAQRRPGVPVLSSRYHSFLRAPEGLYIDLATRRLQATTAAARHRGDRGQDEERIAPIYEVAVCRHCGEAYILGTEESGQGKEGPCLSPRRQGSDDDDYVPHTYYRLMKNADDVDDGETALWLCPACGALHEDPKGGVHRFEHDEVAWIPLGQGVANEEFARCGHCGYQNRYAIQPMRVSPEAAGSVVCYDLVRQVPAFGLQDAPVKKKRFTRKKDQRRAGSVICFSDRRQDAAYFAPSMERTYGKNTCRQIIREAVDDLDEGEGCTFNRVRSRVESLLDQHYESVCKGTDNDLADLAEAWLLDELSAQDARNSLDGLGVVRVEPTEFYRILSDPEVEGFIEELIEELGGERFGWLTVGDYRTLLSYCLDDMRRRGVITDAGMPMRGNLGQPARMYLENVPTGADARDCVNFVGSATGSENGRSRFIRKYARRLHGAAITRDDAAALARSLGDFLWECLGPEGYEKAEGSPGSGITFDRGLWRYYRHKDADRVFVCDTCGCATHVDTHGVCPTMRCEGHLRKTTYAEMRDRDRYYKQLYCDDPMPIRIEEHTAQLSTEQAREIQRDFISGKVNVLSCTTTFELGVDVGDLRAVFMRNVPPSVANYAQRAGRVGRRAGMPGYAITFCRLRPHDLAYFKDPVGMIEGSTPVPAVYLDNAPIAIRHIFAIALSEFFRWKEARGEGCFGTYHEFMDLAQERPRGYEELASYLSSHPESVGTQISQVAADASDDVRTDIVDDWGWLRKLLGEEGDEKLGRLLECHELKHSDYQHVANEIERTDLAGKKSRLYKTVDALKKEPVIAVLAGGGVLPKYGFPTDVVELQVQDRGDVKRGLQLQRGLRQAIREYAPGSEVIAAKQVWKSRGIRKPLGQELIKRRFGKCEQCQTFVSPIDIEQGQEECPACGAAVLVNRRMLIPSFGFVGVRERHKAVGERRPRIRGSVSIKVAERELGEAGFEELPLPGGLVRMRAISRAQLFALNENGSKGFWTCSYCYAAAGEKENIDHWGYCSGNPGEKYLVHYHALGTDFSTDVLEMRFVSRHAEVPASEAYESAMWALHAAAVRRLQVPETEVGCTFFKNSVGGTSILLYDDVPGGAGHCRQLHDEFGALLRDAYRIVDECTCDEGTCCYGCLSSYLNQNRQSELSRGAARGLLASVLFEGVEEEAAIGGERFDRAAGGTVDAGPASISRQAEGSGKLLELEAAFDGPNLFGYGFKGACEYPIDSCASNDERSFLHELAELGAERDLELPQVDVTFSDAEGNEADAVLAWERARVLILHSDSLGEFKQAFGAFGDDWSGIAGWSLFVAGCDDPRDVLRKLEG